MTLARKIKSAVSLTTRPRKSLGILFALLIGLTCTRSPQQHDYDTGVKLSNNKAYDQAIGHFEKVIAQDPESELGLKAAKEAARISEYESKDFQKASRFLKTIILNSKEQPERLEAERRLADLYFTGLQDYKQAATEYSRLLEATDNKAAIFGIRLQLARSYFYLNNFFQAKVEAEELLKQKDLGDRRFDALLLLANIVLSDKKPDQAIEVLTSILKEFPERSKAENVGLVLTICYEEKKDFAKAIETLRALEPDYPRKEFLAKRIKSLQERLSYLPGAKGLKK